MKLIYENSLTELINSVSSLTEQQKEEVIQKVMEYDSKEEYCAIITDIHRRAILMCRSEKPHTYYKAVGTRELERLLKHELRDDKSSINTQSI